MNLKPPCARKRHKTLLKGQTMLSFFKKDPVKKLKKAYMAKLEQAMHAQRNGDIKTYSQLSTEAEAINAEITKLEAKS
jgi:hypothetical protein